MTRNVLTAHLFGPGPKRILALDGERILGILTLQLLMRIEKNGHVGDRRLACQTKQIVKTLRFTSTAGLTPCEQ